MAPRRRGDLRRAVEDRIRIGNARTTLNDLVTVKGDHIAFGADPLQLVFVLQVQEVVRS